MSVDPVAIVPSSESQQPVQSATDSSAGSVSGDTVVSSLDELKQVARPLYDAIMMSIAMQVRNDQNASNDRLKQILRDSQNQ